MKKEHKADKGVIFVLLERFNKTRLPRALEMKKRVDGGECLAKADHLFLKRVFADASQIRQLVARNPEFQKVADDARNLWQGIVDKDKENQKTQK